MLEGIRSGRRAALVVVLALATVSFFAPAALAADDPPKPPAESVDQRLERLEKLLADTRRELAALKGSSSASEEEKARLAEIERRIDVLAQEIEQLKLGEAGGVPVAASAPAATPAGSGVTRGVGPAASPVS